jgi:hypothetical protein
MVDRREASRMVNITFSTTASSKTKAAPSTRASRDRACTLLSSVLIMGALLVRIFIMEDPVRNAKWVLSGSDSVQDPILPLANAPQVILPTPHRTFLPLNPTCTIVQDLVSIEHVPDESLFVVTTKPDGKCPNPYLRGRLSGPALVLLDWSVDEYRLLGHYIVPVSGLYFVEIIVVMCQDFSMNMDFDFDETCVEDPERHRLPKSNAKVAIQVKQSDNQRQPVTTNSQSRPTMGYWMHQQDERAAQQDFAPVYTRFQPRGCLRLDDPTHEHFHLPPRHCVEPTDLHRFEPYTQTFQYTTSVVATNPHKWWEGSKHIKASKPTTLCLIGDSHSRTLKASLIGFHNFTMANNNLEINWIKANYPRHVNNQTIGQKVRGHCDKILIGVAQWPASFTDNKPTSFRDYASQVKKMFGRLQDHLQGNGDVDIWAWSVHDNPLNERIAGYCPPKDWRSPTVLEGYNHILRNACRDTPGFIRFLSTRFIVGPLWDASSDWGHVLPLASHVEALYIVACVLGLVEPNTY